MRSVGLRCGLKYGKYVPRAGSTGVRSTDVLLRQILAWQKRRFPDLASA